MAIGHFVEDMSARVRDAVSVAPGYLGWATEALISGIFGLAVGLVLLVIINVGSRVFRRG
jgi:predicted DNA repair protein MutK